jgi:hypothetical protein
MVLIIFGPFIYFIVSFIADYVSYKGKEIKRKKYYGEEELINISTYQNNNISYEDIMLIFYTQIKKYRQRYFIIDYKLFDKKNEQNYAWSIKTAKQTYGWGVIYNIQFNFSNGWVYLSFSNNQFSLGDKGAREYYSFRYDFGTLEIANTLKICRDEAKIIWKMNGREPAEYSPFNYIPLSESYRSSQENTTQFDFDMASFYRNLLGLKLHFSYDELKKSYREAIGKYHPDRYGASSPRDRENAEMLMKQVNEAYENLKKIAV